MKAVNILLLAILLSYNGCKKGDNPVGPDDGGNSNKIQIGEMVDITTQSTGTAGGTIKINKPGDKLDGMEIVIPLNAFTESKTFTISSAEIKGHQLGEYVNPISPLIKISYEGGYSDDILEVKIPVKVPKGEFAMGFFYDENTGMLEGLPLLDSDSTSVTVCSRHFSTSTLSPGSSLKSLFKRNDLTSFSNMIISSIKESILFGQPVISTGYKLKEDDWEFPNYGSYISPGGHCAGQSISSMWYYYEKKLRGAPNLYGQFDEVDKLWTDNPKGYRFASTIQEDISWEGRLYNFLLKFELSPSYHFLGWRAFAYTMLLGEPQFVGLSRDKAGHAIVAYKMSIPDSTLYVADPNFPGEIRTIKYKNGQFQPYSTKQNALEADTKAYTGIGYYAKTTMIDWDKIGRRWKEFEDGTIGNYRFPAYQLWMANWTGGELKDGTYTMMETLEIYSKSTQCVQCLPGTDHFQMLNVYNNKGDLIASGDTLSSGIALVNLKLGLNKIGFYVMGARDNHGDNYVDFKWMNIIRDTLAIDPDFMNGQPNKEYTFTARTYGTAPKSYKMIWNFGDNTPVVTVNNDSTVKHTFTSLDVFMITVIMRNQANENIADAAGEADITALPISIISNSANGEPILIPGALSKEYTFTAKTNGQAPKNGKAKFVWNFGDNSPAVTIMNDSLVTHTFTKAGSFTINVKVYDDTKLIVEGNAAVNIKSTAQIDIKPADPYGEPISIAGKVNKEYTFIGSTNGTAPNPYKMVWNFGDSTPEVTDNNDSTIKHTYTSAGQFSIKVQLYNQSNIKLAEDNSIADIRAAEFSISRMKPDYGPWGDTVSISGTGFGNTKGISTVTFKSEKTAASSFWSDTLIKVIVPAGTISGNVTVTVGGVSKTAYYYTCVGSLIDSLKTKKSIYCFFTGSFNFSDGSTSAQTIGIVPDYPVKRFTWLGNSFKYEDHTISGSGTSEVRWKISGEFDAKGLMLISLNLEYTLIYYESGSNSKITNKYERGFSINNVPWEKHGCKYAIDISGGIKNHISSAYYNYWSESTTVNSTSLDWTSQNSQYVNFQLAFFN